MPTDFTKIIKTHILVPKHEKLSKTQEKELLTSAQLDKENLPKIRLEDAAIQELGPKLGDIIRIERKSPTAGDSYFYRVVSNE
ncbi:DNA-directed RNA polymerase subunit H [Pseudomonadota bacterium]